MSKRPQVTTFQGAETRFMQIIHTPTLKRHEKDEAFASNQACSRHEGLYLESTNRAEAQERSSTQSQSNSSKVLRDVAQ
jgi:hypothetical protein